jgi:hypothetical protein
MILKNLKVSNKEENLKISVEVESKNEKKELWFSVPKKYEEGICKDQYDSFLVGMLYPAMELGENILIKGKVSSKLLFNINNYIIPLICSFSNKVKKIKVEAEEISYKNYAGTGVGTGFSGGVDSFSTVYDHYELEKDKKHKINSFLFLNVGSHGNGDEKEVYSKFMKRYDFLKKFPEEIGLEFIPVNSNLYKFHPWGHQLTHTLTSVSGILILQKKYCKYYYASAGLSYIESFKFFEEWLEHDIGIFDPILLSLLSTESLELVSDGIQYTRVEKVKNIINYEPVSRYLNVCVSGEDTHENCSVCSKCCRTLMTLDSLGKIEEFSSLFDIKKYRKEAERRYLAEQVLNQDKNAYARDNVELAKINNKLLPSKFTSIVILFPNILKKFIIEKIWLKLSIGTRKKIKKILGK